MASKLLAHRSWYFSWGDGWGANISVQEVHSCDLRRMKKQSRGFCGYEWMVESILACGEIRQTIRDESGKIVQSPYIDKKLVEV